MRLGRAGLFAAFLLPGAAACGLDLAGTLGLGADGGGVPAEDGGLDATIEGGDDGATGSDGSAAVDTGSDAHPIDAGYDSADAPDTACGPLVVVSDDFSAGIGSNWSAVGSTVAVDAGGTNGSFVMLTPRQGAKQGELVYLPGFGLGTFRVDFQYFFDYGGQTSVADGLAFGWYDHDASSLGPSVGGKAMGLPKETGGNAVLLDLNQNLDIGDPATPVFSLVKLDATKDPGTVDWHVQSSLLQVFSLTGGAWHSARIVVQGGLVSATADGLPVLALASAPPLDGGTFGFSAGTGGGNPVGASIDSVVVVVPNPLCPNAFP
jgi:hypothetical protein